MRILILILIFVTILVVQQSHLFVTVKTQKAGITVDEYQVKWDNLDKYFKNICRTIDRKIHPRR